MITYRCYPINTVLVDFNKLQEYLKTHPDPYDMSSESSDSSDDEENKDDSSDSSSSTVIIILNLPNLCDINYFRIK